MTMRAKTLVASFVGAAWFGTYVLKGIRPEIEFGLAPDALMTTIVGWFFNEKRKEANAAEEE